jgi:hypothetical protein
LSSLKDLENHARFAFTLRTIEENPTYHSLLLFRLSEDDGGDPTSPQKKQLYVMEASCPHLGADLSHAEIEDLEEEDHDFEKVIVCPWHRYAVSYKFPSNLYNVTVPKI